eukprot:TRINITY_DN13780_c0_g1_i1.p1 TRINITY_DN13780_c0_g1~~TRINITY_DN13780_c0_g1_i1.p1  ORF type:complete len:413 (-),score=84.33 TRINITY_DN13780_c0_g1_i1:414-1652(-)
MRAGDLAALHACGGGGSGGGNLVDYDYSVGGAVSSKMVHPGAGPGGEARCESLADDLDAPWLPGEPDLSMEVVAWLKQVVNRTNSEWLEETKLGLHRLPVPEELKRGPALADCSAVSEAGSPPSSGSVGRHSGFGDNADAAAGPVVPKAVAATAPVPLPVGLALAAETEARSHESARRHAAAAIGDVTAVLRRFYPDMPQEDLTMHVHSVIHAADFTLGTEPRLRSALHTLVPLDRRDWLTEDVTEHVAAVMGLLSTRRWLGLQASAIAKDPAVRAAMVGGSAGALALGTAGAPIGMVAGGLTGALIGIVPACFTFCLSIPAFAVVGGTVGAGAGAVAGASAGFFGGSAAGTLGYSYRRELKAFAVDVSEYTQATLRVVREAVRESRQQQQHCKAAESGGAAACAAAVSKRG